MRAGAACTEGVDIMTVALACAARLRYISQCVAS